MKLLKQFHSPRAAYTSLKRGGNERAAGTSVLRFRVRPRIDENTANEASCEGFGVNLINTRFQPGVAERQREETVSTVSWIENLK